ncbi:MAG TPA: c-type cytochrome [Intrasporangiaceae bacterium]|nr:c-type cytochrome [Intrasporangiaceae bacterium]
MNALAARRRHPAAIALLLMLALVVTGGLYAALAPKPASAAAVTADQVEEGQALFRANCASCHGLNAEGNELPINDTKNAFGPSLVGAGAAAVHFQMETGRMPMAAPGPQAPRVDKVKFTPEQIDAIAAYVASLGPGPARPDEEWLDWEGQGNAGRGGTIYRSNCAMCHSSAAAGGALTRGKHAPPLDGVEPVHIYEAMLTGPQNMPVFNDQNLTPEDKRDVIAYVKEMHAVGSPGGIGLGGYGPASEGMFIWLFGLGIMIGTAVWLGQKGA